MQGIGIVEMMDIAYELGAGEKLGINKRTFAVPCNVRAYDGHISVEWMYDRLSSKAKSFWMFAAPIFMMITRTGIIPWILIVNLKGE